jgi:hypothetical protein
MTTCQTINWPIMLTTLSLSRNVVSTPHGTSVWSAPRGKISVYKVENTLGIILEPTVDYYKIENRRNR